MHRFPVGFATDVGESSHGLEDSSEARAVSVGTCLTEPGDTEDHEPRLSGPQGLFVQTPSIQRTRAKVLHEYVNVGQHAQQKLASFRLAQIESA
ncbi:hypothetical protein D3C86_1298900 [compost metagenome]